MITTDAYFEKIREEILEELDLANNSIYVAVAWFTDSKLLKKLIQKLKQGVKVYLIVTDDKINHQCDINFNELMSEGGFFKYITGELMHNKFCIIDKRVVITGSYNWTKKAASSNQENITITQGDFDLAFRFIQQFNTISGLEQKAEEKLDYSRLLKRLKIIKELIALGDEEDLLYQSKRIKNEVIDDEIQQIISFIENKNYEQAFTIIENFIISKSRVIVYLDPRVSALQLDIKNIKFRIVSIDKEISETNRKIYQFNTLYYSALGDVISRILELKENYYKKNKDRSKYHKEDYEKAKKEKTEFNYDKETVIEFSSFELNDDEKIKLKKIHRKGVVLCHPDKVPDKLKEKATKIFNELQSAYEKQDLAKVTEIVKDLEVGQWGNIKETEITDLEILKLKKKQYEESLKEKLTELKSLNNSEVYKEFNTIGNLNEYLLLKKEQLEKELIFWKEKNENEAINS